MIKRLISDTLRRKAKKVFGITYSYEDVEVAEIIEAHADHESGTFHLYLNDTTILCFALEEVIELIMPDQMQEEHDEK